MANTPTARLARMFFLPTASLFAALAFLPVPQAHAQTLKIALRQDPDILDPTFGRTYIGRIVFAGLCDKLFDIDAKLNIVPQLATGFKWDDPTTLTIKLRPGVMFQNGEKLDAAAVAYSIDRYQTMKGSFRRGELAPVQSVEVVDPLTVKLHLKSPYSPLLYQLTDRAGMILAPAAAKAGDKDFGLHPVCAGPFSFKERVAQDHITLDRFPGYWNAKAIHFDSVNYVVLPDTSVRLANLQSGVVDISEEVVPSDVAAVKADKNLDVVMGDGLGYSGISINVANGKRADTPMGHDFRVRKAFELSIDRKALIQVVYNGMFTPTAQGIPPGSPFFDATLKVPGRDVARARALLKEAGVATPYTVELTAPNQPDIAQAAEVIQSMAAEAGFDVKIKLMEFASSLKAQVAGDYETYLIGWSGRGDPDGNVYGGMHSGGPFNSSGYASKEMDELLDRAREISGQAERKALYAKAARLEEHDVPYIYLWSTKNIVGLNKRVRGFVEVPDGMIRLQGVHFAK
jgi:peptide/nickel transport system substrate-binding protein